jgi:hypothetical protein
VSIWFCGFWHLIVYLCCLACPASVGIDIDPPCLIHPAHLNTSYRHFFLFINEFDLVDKKELAPLDELNDAILAEDMKTTR